MGFVLGLRIGLFQFCLILTETRSQGRFRLAEVFGLTEHDSMQPAVSDISVRVPRPKSAWMRAVVEPPLSLVEHALGIDDIESMAREVAAGDPATPLMSRILRVTGLRPQIAAADLAKVPKSGAVVVCCNHPLGGADSTALLAALLERREDVRFLANGILARIPFLAQYCFFVDPFGGSGAAGRNAAQLRAATEWLQAGHLLATFPAGEVSAARWGHWSPVDPPWSTIPARLALRTKAKVVPVWCEGTNSRLFQAVGLLHPRLRTALLAREFVARCGAEIVMRVGRALSSDDVAALDAEELTRLVRGRCELLQDHAVSVKPAPTAQESILPSESTPEQFRAEIEALSQDAVLCREGPYVVLAVKAREIPRCMREIGRLREIAFRTVGEGSGKSIDLDRFDETYTQIVVWNEEHSDIVGGYRAGSVRELTKDVGPVGLYTSTLFEYSPRITAELDDAIELGRSFVRIEYQRQPLPLSLLWKGIGIFMFRNGYRRMFGPVSISNDYTSMSKELIMEFLERHRLASPFAKLVTPRNPPERTSIVGWTDREKSVAAADIHHVDRLVEEIERGKRAVPVLLRQYLRLNARLLALNVDPDFGDVVDALMLVDIAQIDERIVNHYLGAEAGANVTALLRERFSAR